MVTSSGHGETTKAQQAFGAEDDETRASRMRATRAAEQKSHVSPRGLGASGSMARHGGKELRKIGHVAVATVHTHDAQDDPEETAPAPAPAPEPEPASTPAAEP